MNDLELDVRPILRNGGEPFGAIMGAVAQLARGQRLKLYATFKPVPLFNVMASKGFASDASPLQDGDWMVIFTPVEQGSAATGEASAASPETWPDPAHYLDCTELDPPEPMVRILDTLETMAEGEVLFALLGREPIFLFPELKARGHAWVGDFDVTGDAYRLMIRAGAPL
jgi:TusA-related sulfurtransferase